MRRRLMTTTDGMNCAWTGRNVNCRSSVLVCAVAAESSLLASSPNSVRWSPTTRTKSSPSLASAPLCCPLRALPSKRRIHKQFAPTHDARQRGRTVQAISAGLFKASSGTGCTRYRHCTVDSLVVASLNESSFWNGITPAASPRCSSSTCPLPGCH